MKISSTFRIPDITDWWGQLDEMHSKYADLSNVACDVSSIISHCVGVQASFSLGRHVIGWRQSETTRKTLCEKGVVRQFARANSRILADHNSVLDTANSGNDSEMKKVPQEMTFHRMAKVYHFLKMLQGSHNLRASPNEYHIQNRQMTVVGYISDMEEIIKASWSLFQQIGVAAFELSETSPLPPALSANDLPGG